MSDRWTNQDLAGYQAKRGLKIEVLSVEPEKKKNKFNAQKTDVDGIRFDSKREAHRYQDLKIMQTHGLITDLKLQVSYPLVVNGVHVATYRSDFEYMEYGQKVVEDTKSDYTRKLMWYRMKKKLMLALYGIEIRET